MEKESTEKVTINGIGYSPDIIIRIEKMKKGITIKDCICVFTILNRENFLFREYVGLKYFEELNKINIEEPINGYLPEIAYVFKKENFPIKKLDSREKIILGAGPSKNILHLLSD